MAVTKFPLEALECTCDRCGYTWCPKITKRDGKWVIEEPVQCARVGCKSPHWNRGKKLDKMKESGG